MDTLKKLVFAAGLTTLFATVPAYADHDHSNRFDRPSGHDHRMIAHERRDGHRNNARGHFDRDRRDDRDRHRNRSHYRDDDRHRHHADRGSRSNRYDDRYRRNDRRDRHDHNRHYRHNDDEWALLLEL